MLQWLRGMLVLLGSFFLVSLSYEIATECLKSVRLKYLVSVGLILKVLSLSFDFFFHLRKSSFVLL